ncbi:MAG: SMC-Scp complex subunit ScpB [Acidobacteria bacterium]|nr:SMC-Scp complex subunit ScpB [Acidobacteriota bacterium]
MSEEKQQYDETAIAAEESNSDWQNEERVDDQTGEQEDEQVDEQAIAEILAEDELIEAEFLSFGEEEDAESIRIIASDENLAEVAVEPPPEFPSELPDEAEDDITATREELKPVIEALLFVADEPLPFKQLCKVLGHVPEEDVRAALDELIADYEARNGGLEVREIAGGWRISTRPQHHDFIRKYLKSRPTARLSLPALETLAVIAYKQPITIPEILEIRGVSSTSAIKTLLEKRLIVTKGRKETVGRPMMYGTSKEFLIQFGLKDLTELPSIEDFEDLAQ